MNLLHADPKNFSSKLLLRCEMVVKTPRFHAGLLTDVTERGLSITSRAEQFRSHVQNLLA